MLSATHLHDTVGLNPVFWENWKLFQNALDLLKFLPNMLLTFNKAPDKLCIPRNFCFIAPFVVQIDIKVTSIQQHIL